MGKDQGPTTLAVMWAFTALTLLFVLLRLYTRIVIIRSPGADDVAYVVSGLLLLLYTSFMQVSLGFGFGRSVYELEPGQGAQAIMWEMIGQTFAIIGMSVAKISLGLFLLRLVVTKWHRVAIWTVMLSLFACSCATAAVLWTQCTPVQGIYDARVRPTAKCDVPITPIATMLGVWCIVADFFFAIFPAVVVWGLNMKKKEKIIIAASMSLGVFAGAAGIVRTYEVAVGFTANYTEDTVGLIIWSAVEMAVTMVCIGIPILRPLYRRVIHGYGYDSGNASGQKYQKHSEGNSEHPQPGYELETIGRISNKPRGARDRMSKLGMQTQTMTDIQTANGSDEQILYPGALRLNDVGGAGQQRGIHVKDDVKVEWNDR